MANLNAWKQQWNVFHYQFPCRSVCVLSFISMGRAVLRKLKRNLEAGSQLEQSFTPLATSATNQNFVVNQTQGRLADSQIIATTIFPCTSISDHGTKIAR